MDLLRLIFTFGAVYYVSEFCGASEETPLVKQLLEGYDPSVRPVQTFTDVLNFTIDVSLNQVLDVDERKQEIKINIWMRWHWYDAYLTWNKSEHGGIKEVYIKPSRIRLPRGATFATENFLSGGSGKVGVSDDGWPSHYNVKVCSDGRVTYLFPVFLEASCKIDVAHFPFDTQTCALMFGSWVYSASQFDIYPLGPTGNLDNLVPNGEWEVVGMPTMRNVKHYASDPEPYPNVIFSMILKRLHFYHVYNQLMPCIVITFINLFTFLLPVESGEKIALNVTVLLTMVVFLLVVAETMPHHSIIPVLGLYFGMCIVLLSLGTLASVFVIHLHSRGSRGRPVPRWLKCIFRWLGFFMCYNQSLAAAKFSRAMECSESKKHQQRPFESNDQVVTTGLDSNGHSVTEVEIENESELAETETTREKEWFTIALILDRVFFILFLLGTTAITGYVLSYMV